MTTPFEDLVTTLERQTVEVDLVQKDGRKYIKFSIAPSFPRAWDDKGTPLPVTFRIDVRNAGRLCKNLREALLLSADAGRTG